MSTPERPMRLALLLIAFAPIRLCRFEGIGGDPWVDTFRWEDWDAAIQIDSPERSTVLCVDESVRLSGFVDFSNAPPQDGFAVFNVDGREVCSGQPDAQGQFGCDYNVRVGDVPVLEIVFTVFHPSGQVIEDSVRSEVQTCGEPDTDVDTDTQEPAPLTLRATSPQPSSVWSTDDPIPFVASVQRTEPLTNVRVVWQIDGVQIPDLTGRTNSQGNVVTVASFAAGPHEAVATAVVDGITVSQATRFIVQDIDADSDSDTP